jgi:hypothetical protein
MKIRLAAGLVIVAAVLGVSADARADQRTFTVDPARSSLTFSGSLAGIEAEAQIAGSDTARYTGSLMVDVTGTTIRFLEGSLIDAQAQHLVRPGSGGSNSAALADYGFIAEQPFGIDTGEAAFRDFIFRFASTDARTDLFVQNGFLDYRFQGVNNENGRESQAGEGATNNPGAGTLSTVGNIETLTIPIDANFTFFIFAYDTPMRLTGEIVATRIIPEPATTGLLAAAAGLALMRRRRQGRARG